MRQLETKAIILNGKLIGFQRAESKHEHLWEDSAYTLGNGDVLLEKDVLCPTNEETQKYVEKIAEERNTYISGMTSVCIKCGRIYDPFSDPDLMSI